MKEPHFNTGRKRPDRMAGATVADTNLNIRLPSELREKARQHAASQGTSLTQLIIAHLRAITE